MSNNCFPCGSEWRKWDFHIHTPYSILNNQYGFNPLSENLSQQESEEKFDKFVINLFTLAIENNIQAIGITDYFLIDGYKRIRNEYLSNEIKLAQCFPDEEVRNKVKRIFVFPNIEFRLTTFVEKEAVNYHVIFSDQIPPEKIESDFLSQLKIKSENGTSPLSKEHIIELGKFYLEHNEKDFTKKHHESSELFAAGLERAVVDHNDILDILSKHNFREKCLIAIPVDEDLSAIKWKSRYYTSKREFYRQADVYMTSNAKTREFALGKYSDNENMHIKEFGSLKPCIWGSDAHEYKKMFRPDEDRFCWIKADLTFEGLKQILCEPEERVSIQKDHPFIKDSHQIIDNILIDDDNFSESQIFFSDSLNCIIGGKSTGKSILLREIAHSASPDYVEKQESSICTRSPFHVKKSIVTWRDGTTSPRKVIYIPQTFLNKTIDAPEKTTEIDKIIEKILFQNPKISEAHTRLHFQVAENKSRVKRIIENLTLCHQDKKRIEDTLITDGWPETFKKVITDLEEEKNVLAKKVNFSEDDLTRFNEIEGEIKNCDLNIQQIESEIRSLESVSAPKIFFPDILDLNDSQNISNIERIFPRSNREIIDFFNSQLISLIANWSNARNDLLNRLNNEKISFEEKKRDLSPEYIDLQSKVKENEKLNQIITQLKKETLNYESALKNEKELDETLKKIESLHEQLADSQSEFLHQHEQYCSTIAKCNGHQSELTFKATPIWRSKDFTSQITSIFDNRNFSTYRARSGYDLLNLDGDQYGQSFLKYLLLSTDPAIGRKELSLKTSIKYPQMLELIFDDWYNIHYSVISERDELEQMSPGKKASVLLELLISLDESKCPILIDQPEDDLDNRSIYSGLVEYLKRKKRDRQIIVVTHNANIVVGADSEQVIIANQDGKDSINSSGRRFEYRCGSIENDQEECDENGQLLKGVLSTKGIQTQICDILEGGERAFMLRKQKYTSLR